MKACPLGLSSKSASFTSQVFSPPTHARTHTHTHTSRNPEDPRVLLVLDFLPLGYFFNWSVAAFQCCVSFCCSVSESAACTHAHPLPLGPPSHPHLTRSRSSQSSQLSSLHSPAGSPRCFTRGSVHAHPSLFHPTSHPMSTCPFSASVSISALQASSSVPFPMTARTWWGSRCIPSA